MFANTPINLLGEHAQPRAFAILESTLRSGYLIIKILFVLAKAKALHLFEVMD